MTSDAFPSTDILGSTTEKSAAVAWGVPLRVLLVEDDPGDALLVEELLSESDLSVTLEQVGSVAEALPRLAGVDCVLLDLALPDSLGLDGLRTVLAADRRVSVVVLTGLADQGRGAEAVASGAQDYLSKAEVDASLLGRSVRYAIERRRADEATRRLFEAELQRATNERIQRGLLPRLLVTDPGLEFATRYRPGGGGEVLGGDFFDGVELDDGTVRAVIGDVCGHGPDEAALGVSLRIAWRALVLAGTETARVLPALDDVLVAERQHDEVFVTVCDLTIIPERHQATIRLAGHPPPVVLGEDAQLWPSADVGPPLGVIPGVRYGESTVELPSTWSLLLYTDGLIEGRWEGGDRLGLERLVARLAGPAVKGTEAEELLEGLVTWAESHHGGSLPDDVALFLLSGATA